MSKSINKVSSKSPKQGTKSPDRAYLVGEALNEQQHAEKGAGISAAVTKASASAAMSEPSGAGPAAPAKPLAPLATVWPSSTQLPAGTKPSQTTAPAARVVVAPAQKPSASQAVNVTFALAMAGAKRVSVCGEFNRWSIKPMKRRDDGYWETTVALTPGQYQYKFLVDGEWVLDPAALKSVPNLYGSMNSVLEIRA